MVKLNEIYVNKLMGFLIILVLASWAFYFEPASLAVNEVKLEFVQLPLECRNIKVAVLADLHIGSPFNGLDKLRHIVLETNKIKPDIVLLPGDFVVDKVLGGEKIHIDKIAAELGLLNAAYGSYAVLGNHDWHYGALDIVSALERVKIIVLEDKSMSISIRHCQITLVGISDLWEGRHDVKKALEHVDVSENTIVFTHNPDVIIEIPEFIALTVAGHTHGGQINLPFLGRPMVPSKFGDRYAAGYLNENNKNLFVSSGLGTSIFGARFLVRPEISILVF